jgi:hypothetical protein
MQRLTLALSLTGLIAIAPISGSQAAPLMPLSVVGGAANNASAARDDLTPVHWRGGWEIGAGLLAGALIGSAVAAPRYYDPYPPYRYGYSYGYGRYYPAYAYTPYYGWGPRVYRWGPSPWRYSYGWSQPRPWGYTVRRAYHWRHSYGWMPRHHRHHHHQGVIRAHHRR